SIIYCTLLCFFFSSRRRHTRSKRDWSSDVCSSDLFIQQIRRADLLDEAVGQFVGHVQPEARRPPAQPGVDDAAFSGDEPGVRGVLLVYFGQGLEAPPAAVAALVVGGEIVPGAVGGMGVPPGPLAAIAPFLVEVDAVRAGVAEHPVQHDADAIAGSGLAQLLKILVGAKE